MIGGAIVGSAIIGAAAYLFLTETGSSVRRQATDRLSRLKESIFGLAAEPVVAEEPGNMQEPQKASKTDREPLKKNEVLHEQNPDDSVKGTPQS